MSEVLKRRMRCAVYTRKSSEEGLDQEYNSIDAQRDAGHAYIASQRTEGWIAVADDYDDPAFSGGNMERPALKRLMADIEAGKIDVIVIYKIDRLTRSLADFSKMVEVFERQGVSFVSVTQQFNTTTSMGRLMLNVLLSFAQFEREVTGERIRDKIAASKRKGMWMGGIPPIGYDVANRRLIPNEAEAKTIAHIFQRFVELGSTTKLVKELRLDGVTSKAWTTQDGKVREGKPIDKGLIYKVLNNRTYLGELRHKELWYQAEHPPIITKSIWDDAHAILSTNGRVRATTTRAKTQYLLKGTQPQGGLKPGDFVLFHAAAGGVGLIACQWAKALGLRLIGTAGSDAKCALALANGAEFCINYSTEDFQAKVKEITGGKGVKVVYDSVGKDTWDKSLDCLAPFGLMASFGNA